MPELAVPPDSRAVPDSQRPAREGSGHVAFGVALALVATLFVIAARSSPESVQARSGRRVALVELIAAEQERVRTMEARVQELSEQVGAYEQGHATQKHALGSVQAQIAALSGPAGLTEVIGPGVVATLADSAMKTSPSGNLNDLVIHEQDLQAVINALWAGGAEAITVNGERILATTAIRCVGNTLLLHGQVYSPPYKVAAIGDAVALRTGLDRDPVVARLRDAAGRYGLGFQVSDASELRLPAYSGTAALQVARPSSREDA